MIKRAVVSFIILMMTFIGCGSDPWALDEPRDKNVISFTLLADSNLKEDTKISIMSALAEWDIKVGEHIGYKVVFKDLTKEPNNTENNTYVLYVRDPGPGLLGWTSWTTKTNTATILMKPSMTPETFKVVLLHELGHAFDLHFDKDIHYTGELKSIMHPAIGNTNKLECVDLVAFCTRYNCQVDCQFEGAAPQYLQSAAPVNVCETPEDLTSNIK